MRVSANITGDDVFGGVGDNDNIFLVMKDLSRELGLGNQGAIGAILGRLDSRNEAFLQTRADVGARQNRIELSQARLEDISLNLQTLQAKEEDADIPGVITNLKQMKTFIMLLFPLVPKSLARVLLIFFVRRNYI